MLVQVRGIMNYPNVLAIANLKQPSIQPSTEEQLATAIAGLVNAARAEGQSLEDLMAQVLAEDQELDKFTRRWLGEIVAEAWQDFADAA
jgi:uncharacterized protein YicC (UPF0701 family)